MLRNVSCSSRHLIKQSGSRSSIPSPLAFSGYLLNLLFLDSFFEIFLNFVPLLKLFEIEEVFPHFIRSVEFY